MCDAVFFVGKGDPIGSCLNFREGIAHGDPDTGGLQHADVIIGIPQGHDLCRGNVQHLAKSGQSGAFAAFPIGQLQIALHGADGAYPVAITLRQPYLDLGLLFRSQVGHIDFLQVGAGLAGAFHQIIDNAFFTGKERFEMKCRKMDEIAVFPIGTGEIHFLIGIKLHSKVAHGGQMLQDLQGGIQRQRCRPQNMAFPVGGYAAVTGDEVVEKGQFQYLWCNSSQASPGGDYDLDARFGGTGECLTVGRGEGEVVIAQQRSV